MRRRTADGRSDRAARIERPMAIAGGALLPLTAVLFVAHVIPPWAAGLLAGGFLAAGGVVLVVAAERRRPSHSGATENA